LRARIDHHHHHQWHHRPINEPWPLIGFSTTHFYPQLVFSNLQHLAFSHLYPQHQSTLFWAFACPVSNPVYGFGRFKMIRPVFPLRKSSTNFFFTEWDCQLLAQLPTGKTRPPYLYLRRQGCPAILRKLGSSCTSWSPFPVITYMGLWGGARIDRNRNINHWNVVKGTGTVTSGTGY
jgi:hypothetical protein